MNIGITRDMVEELAEMRGLDPDSVSTAVARALVAAYKRRPGAPEEARVLLDLDNGELRVFGQELDEDGNVNAIFKNPSQGAATTLWAATSAALAGRGGVYCEDCDIALPTDPDSASARYQGVDAHAVDPQAARKLWDVSAALTGVNAF